jgi:hypothetical protein
MAEYLLKAAKFFDLMFLQKKKWKICFTDPVLITVLNKTQIKDIHI